MSTRHGTTRFLYLSYIPLHACLTHTHSQVEALRAACNQTFPGAPQKQASIIHTTLLRIVSGAELLTAELVTPIQAALDEWTSKLRGDLYRPSGLWYVIEDEFSTLHGTTEVLPSKGLQGSRITP